MTRRNQPAYAALALGASLVSFLVGCGVDPGGPLPDTATSPGATADPVEDAFAVPENADADGIQSVGDVVSDEQLDPPVFTDDEPLPSGPVVSIRNFDTLPVRLTVLFSWEDEYVHLTVVEILAGTIALVESPSGFDRVELSGTRMGGAAVEPAVFVVGQDFEAGDAPTFEVYPAQGDEGSGDDGSDSPPGDIDIPPPQIIVDWPDRDVSARLGSALTVQWTDQSAANNAVIVIWLRPVGAPDRTRWIQVSPAIAEHLDGINDEIRVVVQGISPGRYEVVAEISDGQHVVNAIAPGRVDVILDHSNVAPSIDLVQHPVGATVQIGDIVELSWTDHDPDSNALISIEFVSYQHSGQVFSYLVGDGIPEDPDGAEADSIRLPIRNLLPGVYDIVVRIDDGDLVGEVQVAAALDVRAGMKDNSAPWITLVPLGNPTEVRQGGSLSVAWDDKDDDDNAIISLMLDPILEGEDEQGDEILLISSIAEDPDGAGSDEILLGIPDTLAMGRYRLTASITDGAATSHSVADGVVDVLEALGGSDGDDDPGDDSHPPAVRVVWPLTETFIRSDERFSLAFALDHIPFGGFPGEFAVETSLINDEASIDLSPAMHQELGGDTFVYRVETSALSIPNRTVNRRFDLKVTLLQRGLFVDSSVVRGAIWIRQHLEITRVHLEGVECQPLGGRNIFGAGGLRFDWFGGGFGAELSDDAWNVEFWLAKDGVWPPPRHNPITHRRVYQSVESPGLDQSTFVEWGAIEDMRDGRYGLIVLIHDPDSQDPLVRRSPGDLIQLCTGVGGDNEPPQP